jgi:vacuole morphology and inheritance protein 14
MVPRGYVPSSNYNHLRQKSSETGSASAPSSTLGNSGSFERPNRLKTREEGGVRWVELLDKFKNTQERARKNARLASLGEDVGVGISPVEKEKSAPEMPPKPNRLPGPAAPNGRPLPSPSGQQAMGHKARGSLSSLGRFAGGVAGRKKK